MKVKIVTSIEGRYSGVEFKCPGCGHTHLVHTNWTPPGVERGERPAYLTASWQFDGNLDRPTLSPSLNMMSGHYCSGQPQPPDCWLCKKYGDKSPCAHCHSFVRDGRIQFLGDCSHALKGQTVDLPEIEDAA